MSICTATLPLSIMDEVNAPAPALPGNETAQEVKASALVAEMPPPPKPTGAPAAENPHPPPAPPAGSMKDKRGIPFDPEKHAVDASGAPRIDKTGRFINRNAGRIGKNATASGSTVYTPPPAPPPPAPPAPPDKYKVASETLISLFQGLLITFGQEEGILDPAEKIALSEPLEQTLRKHDVGDMPPEMALAMVAGSIVLTRLGKPKTQTTVQKIRLWLGSKFAAWQGGKIASRVAAQTHSF